MKSYYYIHNYLEKTLIIHTTQHKSNAITKVVINFYTILYFYI